MNPSTIAKNFIQPIRHFPFEEESALREKMEKVLLAYAKHEAWEAWYERARGANLGSREYQRELFEEYWAKKHPKFK